MQQPRNFKIDDVTLNWARLDRTVNPFGTEQYELQIATGDEAKVKELEANHVPFKRDSDGALKKNPDGEFFASLKRKAIKQDGSSNGVVRVVKADLTPVEDASKIGNGSKGNVILFQYPYETMGRKGIANSLTAVQVTDMKIFTPTGGVDFAVVGGTESAAEPVETQDPVDMF